MWGHFDQNKNKYIVAVVTLATIGGCYLILREKQQEQVQEEQVSSNQIVDDEKTSISSMVPIAHTGRKFPIQVFVRIRPLIKHEIEGKHESISFTTESKKSGKKTASKMTKMLRLNNVSGRNMEGSKEYTGFKSVVLPSHDNLKTYQTCILPYVPNMVVNGESTCVFAYGHTGSGKTYTIFGYPEMNAAGMYQLFARELYAHFERLKADSETGNEYDDICIEVRFTELYQGKVYDLLSINKKECFIREDGAGNVRIRSNPVKSVKDQKMRQFPITSVVCNDEKTLLQTINDGVKSRNVGKSTLHDKSSRSHAFLEFEVVNYELIEQRKQLIEIEATILWEEMKTYSNSPSVKKSKKKKAGINGKIKKLLNDENRKYIGGKMIFIDLAGNEYGRDAVDAMGYQDTSSITEDNGNDEAAAAQAKAKEDARKEQLKLEQRERNEINQSLLSLKECIRGLHENKSHITFRNSKLTLYLKPHLNGELSKAIMISNMGSSKIYTKQSMNTLRYTQLVAKA